jgi:subtilase family serine protease
VAGEVTWTSRHCMGGVALGWLIVVAWTGAASWASDARSVVADVPSWTRAAVLEAQASPTDRMDLRIHLRLRDREGALAEAAAVYDPDDPRYGRYLTPDEFHARYSPTPADLARVTTWLEAHGLELDYASGNRLVIAAHGAVAAVEAAFRTTIGRYRVGDRLLRAPTSAPTAPTEVADLVAATVGIHDAVSPMRPTLVRRPQPMAASIAGARLLVEGQSGIWTAPPAPGWRVPPDCAEYWGSKSHPDVAPFGTSAPTFAGPCAFVPPALRRAYDLPEHGRIDGRGVTVAVVSAFAPQPTLLSDLQTYTARNDPEHPFRADQLEIEMAPGVDPVVPPSVDDIWAWYGETPLDVQAVHAVAPGAKVLLVFTKTVYAGRLSLIEAVNHIVDNRLATIVSNSYADPEELPDDYAGWETVAIQANLEGIGLYFSTGDFGDFNPPVFRPTAGFPASLPQVTAVGGTSLATDERGRRLFEVAWAETASRLQPGNSLLDGTWMPAFPGIFSLAGGGAGSGGTSKRYLQPTYQAGVVPDALARVGDALRRVIPDVSLVGNPNTGLLVGITQSFPEGDVYDEAPSGGTSLSAPLLAGLVALAEQKRGAPVGFINPMLYKHRRKLVRDVVPRGTAPILSSRYDNGVDPTDGTSWFGITLDTELQTLHTTTGYDDTTGLGVPRARAFIRLFGKRPRASHLPDSDG